MAPYNFNSFNIMFTIVPVIIGIGFVMIFGIIIATAIRGTKQWNQNNHSPVLTVFATIVAKRGDVSTYHRGTGVNHMHHTSSSTSYYVTFEVESGDRMEFLVPRMEYGLLVEGDEGKLTFQGKRFKGFKRQ